MPADISKNLFAAKLTWKLSQNHTITGTLMGDPNTRNGAVFTTQGKALAAGGAAPTILNAANEIAVREFVGRRLGFPGIPALVEATLDAADRRGGMAEPQSVDEALEIDHNARRLAVDLLPEIAAMAS